MSMKKCKKLTIADFSLCVQVHRYVRSNSCHKSFLFNLKPDSLLLLRCNQEQCIELLKYAAVQSGLCFEAYGIWGFLHCSLICAYCTLGCIQE